MHRNWAARTPHTGINDTDIDRSWGKVAIARSQNPSARGDMLRRNIMRNVDGVSIGDNAKHNSFQHTDITIAKAKIGHKGNDWTFGSCRLFHTFFLLIKLQFLPQLL